MPPIKPAAAGAGDTNNAATAFSRADALGAAGKPFLFFCDFELDEVEVLEPCELASRGIAFQVPGMDKPWPALPEFRHAKGPNEIIKHPFHRVLPVSPERYRAAFDEVQAAERAGEAWLANLCFPHEVESNWPLERLFCEARAPWKFYIRGRFASWSPECFVRMEGSHIRSWPMKGTTKCDPGTTKGDPDTTKCATNTASSTPGDDTDSPDTAARALLTDPKELAEHTTIVDLIRNDLGRVARDIRVPAFRSLVRVETGTGALWQTHSLVEGRLEEGWQGRIGSMLAALLPAGSVSGAPKARVCRLIAQAEGAPRGLYTGIFGVFDGKAFDSAVLIRAVSLPATRESRESATAGTITQLLYHSGGGVTVYSDWRREYNELKEKIYVPLRRNDSGPGPRTLPPLVSPSAFRSHAGPDHR